MKFSFRLLLLLSSSRDEVIIERVLLFFAGDIAEDPNSADDNAVKDNRESGDKKKISSERRSSRDKRMNKDDFERTDVEKRRRKHRLGAGCVWGGEGKSRLKLKVKFFSYVLNKIRYIIEKFLSIVYSLVGVSVKGQTTTTTMFLNLIKTIRRF